MATGPVTVYYFPGMIVTLFIMVMFEVGIHNKDTSLKFTAKAAQERQAMIGLNVVAMETFSFSRHMRHIIEAETGLDSYNEKTGQFRSSVQLSQRTGIFRNIPDTRPDSCTSITYNIDIFPEISVIIPFHNEAPSSIYRTVNSLLLRTPKRLLREILLVDDASTHGYLQTTLRWDISKMSPKVRLVRVRQRLGLIRARLYGARLAKAGVLFFLDAHCEVNEQWLEPLLLELSKDREVLLSPAIDVIDSSTKEYNAMGRPRNHTYRGTFAWDLEFIWQIVSNRDDKSFSDTDPIPSPTTSGAAMLIAKEYFDRIGGFDKEMDIWGGENIEISFSTWLCGHGIKVVPCSRVGHMFRDTLPYKTFSYHMLHKNLRRVAESWMGEYKKYFYLSTKNVSLGREEARTLRERQRLAARCRARTGRDFTWYLQHVASDVMIPLDGAVWYGQVRNMASGGCWTISDAGHITVTDCAYYSKSQQFSLNGAGRLVFRDKFLITRRSGLILVDVPTTKISIETLGYWTFDTESPVFIQKMRTGRLKIPSGRLRLELKNVASDHSCLTQLTDRTTGKQYVDLHKCDVNQTFQYWQFYHRMQGAELMLAND